MRFCLYKGDPCLYGSYKFTVSNLHFEIKLVAIYFEVIPFLHPGRWLHNKA